MIDEIPSSRQRMMRKTVVASRQRDLLENALERLLAAVARGKASSIETESMLARAALRESQKIGKIFQRREEKSLTPV